MPRNAQQVAVTLGNLQHYLPKTKVDWQNSSLLNSVHRLVETNIGLSISLYPTQQRRRGMTKQAVAINLRTLKTLVIDFLVFKPQFSRRLSRVFFSASSRLSRNFRGRLAGLAQIAAAGRLSRRLRGL